MARQLPVVITATAGVVGLIAALSWPGTAQQLQGFAQDASGALQASVGSLLPTPGQVAGLSAGPRIIHVPPSFGEGADGTYQSDAYAPGEPGHRDEPQHIAPRERTLGSGELKPPQELPPRGEQNRAPAKGSLTPIYPTPRWNMGKQSGKPPGKTQADAQAPR
ncbi:MAG: hypothetical protein OJF62_002588 [Pseudolabrys sp.]|jgi:hypothetical protein|nr:hypothetical protein [Pseudolabrys sp.]